MDQHDASSSPFISFQAPKNNIVDLNKKRKFHSDQSGLPLRKHKCLDRQFSSGDDSTSDEYSVADDITTHIIKGKCEGGSHKSASEPKSGNDSNNFLEDPDSVVSKYREADMEPETSTANDLSKKTSLMEQLPEYRDHYDHIYSQCEEKEVGDVMYDSDEVNPHSYVLSSGRWSVTQEAQVSTKKKPTIDQEFEEYFSMLML